MQLEAWKEKVCPIISSKIGIETWVYYSINLVKLIIFDLWCECFSFSAETPFPGSLMLALGHSMLVKGDCTNFKIEPSFGVEASELYPDVKYTTVDEYLNQFVWDLDSTGCALANL